VVEGRDTGGERELGSAIDVLIATPGRLMAHLQGTPGFTLRCLCLLIYRAPELSGSFPMGLLLSWASFLLGSSCAGLQSLWAPVLIRALFYGSLFIFGWLEWLEGWIADARAERKSL
jgi:hypothetical protein